MPSVDENAIANPNASRPNKKAHIEKNIFMQMTQMKPSISQVKIKPGNLIDADAHQTKTSPIYEPEIMQ